jgi:hypothetical protein
MPTVETLQGFRRDFEAAMKKGKKLLSSPRM